MKVLSLCFSDYRGGAAKAAYRLHNSLRRIGIESLMLVQDRVREEYAILNHFTKIGKFVNQLRPFIDQIPVKKYKNKYIFSPSWFGFSGVVDIINQINPDLVHLHWVCGGMIRVEDLLRLKYPFVWSLHDSWSFTGGCHVPLDCLKYKDTCGACPNLNSKNEYDLSRSVFLRKKNVYSKKNNMAIVGLSSWIASCSQQSALLGNKKHFVLPNPIDIDIFKPVDDQICRSFWNISKVNKVILFGANAALKDTNKGFNLLVSALKMLDDSNFELVVFGASEPQSIPDFGFKVTFVGCVSDDVSLTSLYCSADVVVVPSLQENLSNVIMESLACGTPVVAFSVGGNADLIAHKINGYLAKPYIIDDLKCGIEYILNYSSIFKININARNSILKNFESVSVAYRYAEIYKTVLDM